MPAGLVHQHDAVRARRHCLRQLGKKQVHRSGIERGHHQRDAGVARRAYRPDNPSRLVANIAQPAGGLAALPPDVAGAPLLPDPRLVLAPDLKPLGLGVRLGDLAQAHCKAPLYEAPCVKAYWIVYGAAAKRIRDRPRLFGLRRSPASPYIRSARIGAGTHILHAWGSREVEADGTHLFDGNQSPGGCRSTSFPVRRRQPVEDAASKLAYDFNSAPSGTSPSLR